MKRIEKIQKGIAKNVNSNKGVRVPEQKKRTWLVVYGWAAGFGMTVAVSAYLGLRAGIWLDSQFGSRPFFLLFGTVLGLGFPFYGAYQKLEELRRSEKKPPKR